MKKVLAPLLLLWSILCAATDAQPHPTSPQIFALEVRNIEWAVTELSTQNFNVACPTHTTQPEPLNCNHCGAHEFYCFVYTCMTTHGSPLELSQAIQYWNTSIQRYFNRQDIPFGLWGRFLTQHEEIILTKSQFALMYRGDICPRFFIPTPEPPCNTCDACRRAWKSATIEYILHTKFVAYANEQFMHHICNNADQDTRFEKEAELCYQRHENIPLISCLHRQNPSDLCNDPTCLQYQFQLQLSALSKKMAHAFQTPHAQALTPEEDAELDHLMKNNETNNPIYFFTNQENVRTLATEFAHRYPTCATPCKSHADQVDEKCSACQAHRGYLFLRSIANPNPTTFTQESTALQKLLHKESIELGVWVDPKGNIVDLETPTRTKSTPAIPPSRTTIVPLMSKNSSQSDTLSPSADSTQISWWARITLRAGYIASGITLLKIGYDTYQERYAALREKDPFLTDAELGALARTEAWQTIQRNNTAQALLGFAATGVVHDIALTVL